MGIQFKGSRGKTVPTSNGSIKERELLLDFDNNQILTSSNGTDIVSFGSTEKGGTRWDPKTIYAIGDLAIVEDTVHSNDLLHHVQYICIKNGATGVDPLNDTTGAWREYNVVKWIDTDIEITVGTNGDFDKLDTALRFLGKYSTIDLGFVTVRILSGHVIDYMIEVYGVQFPDCAIVQDDPSTTVVIDSHPSNYGSTRLSLINFINCNLGSIILNLNVVGRFHPSFSSKQELRVIYFGGSSCSLTVQIDVSQVNFFAGSGGYKVIYLTDGSNVTMTDGEIICPDLSSSYNDTTAIDSYRSVMRIQRMLFERGKVIFSHASRGSMNNCNFTKKESFIFSQTGSSIYTYANVFDGDASDDLVVSNGGIISSVSQSASANISTNSIENEGIVFSN